MRYAIVIEKAGENFSAYVPDLPGCIATAKTRRGVERLLQQAISLHLQGLREDGARIPRPTATTAYVDAPAPGRGRRSA